MGGHTEGVIKQKTWGNIYLPEEESGLLRGKQGVDYTLNGGPFSKFTGLSTINKILGQD